MSLIVYTKKSQFSKEDFILDVNSSFKGCNFSGSDFCKRVVSDIDRGTYLNSTSFIDRFGYKLYSKFLSTTSKALICLDEFPDRVVNFCEVGNDVDVVIAGKSFKNADDMYWYLEEEYV